jgi:hypothetical protein
MAGLLLVPFHISGIRAILIQNAATEQATAQKFRNAIGDPDLAIFVSENRVGIDGFVKVCSTALPPLGVACAAAVVGGEAGRE